MKVVQQRAPLRIDVQQDTDKGREPTRFLDHHDELALRVHGQRQSALPQTLAIADHGTVQVIVSKDATISALPALRMQLGNRWGVIRSG